MSSLDIDKYYHSYVNIYNMLNDRKYIFEISNKPLLDKEEFYKLYKNNHIFLYIDDCIDVYGNNVLIVFSSEELHKKDFDFNEMYKTNVTNYRYISKEKLKLIYDELHIDETITKPIKISTLFSDQKIYDKLDKKYCNEIQQILNSLHKSDIENSIKKLTQIQINIINIIINGDKNINKYYSVNYTHNIYVCNDKTKKQMIMTLMRNQNTIKKIFESFSINEISINPTYHVYQPKFRLISDHDNIKKIYDLFNAEPWQFPSMLDTDIIAKWFYARSKETKTKEYELAKKEKGKETETIEQVDSEKHDKDEDSKLYSDIFEIDRDGTISYRQVITKYK